MLAKRLVMERRHEGGRSAGLWHCEGCLWLVRRSVSLWKPWNSPNGFTRSSIPGRAGELALEGCEGFDDLLGLESPVTTTDCDLLEDAGFNQPSYCFVGVNKAAANQVRSAIDCHDRCADEHSKKEVGGRSSADPAKALPPLSLDGTCLPFEGGCVVDCSAAGSGKPPDPQVGSLPRGFGGGGSSVPSSGKATDVVLRPGGEDQRDRR